MATNNISYQLYHTGGAALDAKTQPVEKVSDLSAIPVKARYAGMCITVLNNVYDEDEELVSSTPMECWLVGETTNACWRIKSIYPLETYADLMSATTMILTSFSKMLNIGTEATVLADETNEGKLTKYWITSVNSSTKTAVWEKMGGNVDLTGYAKESWVNENYIQRGIEGEDIEI